MIEILMLITASLAFINLWVTHVTLERDAIPTVINGLTSSISLIVGFTGAIITIVLTNPSFKRARSMVRIIITIITLALAIGVLWTTYSCLINAEYDSALKVSMTGLLISLYILIDFLGFLSSQVFRSRQFPEKARARHASFP